MGSILYLLLGERFYFSFLISNWSVTPLFLLKYTLPHYFHFDYFIISIKNYDPPLFPISSAVISIRILHNFQWNSPSATISNLSPPLFPMKFTIRRNFQFDSATISNEISYPPLFPIWVRRYFQWNLLSAVISNLTPPLFPIWLCHYFQWFDCWYSCNKIKCVDNSQ